MFGAILIISTWFKTSCATPVYKKKSKAFKDNYRPVSILSNISKVYERCIYDQIHTYFDKILSKYQCRLKVKVKRLKFTALPNCFNWKMEKSLDTGSAFEALLTDLSKAIDCLSFFSINMNYTLKRKYDKHSSPFDI